MKILRKRLSFLIFLFFLTINLLSNGGHMDQHDGIVYLSLTENIIKNYSIKFNPSSETLEKLNFNTQQYLAVAHFHQTGTSQNIQLKEMYVGAAPLLSFIAVPLYIISVQIQSDPIHFVPYFLNSIIIALTSLVVFLFSKEFFSTRISFVLALVLSISSFIWPYVTSMFLQPLVGLFLILNLYFLFNYKKKQKIYFAALSSTFLGLTLIAHPGHAILIPGFFIFSVYHLRNNKKSIITFVALFAILLIIQAGLNELRFDEPFDFGYGKQQMFGANNSVEGLAGSIISPGFGIIINYPLFLLFPFGTFLIYRHVSKSLAFLSMYAFVISWIFFGTLQTPFWSGYGAWGPRYFVPLLPFITIMLGIILKNYGNSIKVKTLFIFLACVGFFVNFLGTLVWHQYAYSYGWAVEGLWEVENSYANFAWDLNHIPIILHLKVLFSDYISKIPVLYSNDYHVIGLAPCQYDLYIFCEFGIFFFIGILLIAIMFFVILRIIKKIYFQETKI